MQYIKQNEKTEKHAADEETQLKTHKTKQMKKQAVYQKKNSE